MVKKEQRGIKPATTPEGRESQLIDLAVRLAEKQLLDGSASSSVITHYLKLGTSREKLEREILERQAKLIEAKAANIAKDSDVERLTKEAMDAMRGYQSSSK
jgi:hypothetical protein